MEEANETNPAPPPRKRGRPRIYGFDELEPGECFIITGKRRDDIAPCLYAAKRRTGFTLMAMNTYDGVRVWRSSSDRWSR